MGALARLERDTPVELWTSSATHALLPLLASDAGVRLQLAAGTASHERRFGGFGGGLWLPECAYVPGLERELADVGVTVTCVDQTNVHGFGAPEQLEPVLTAAGVVAVPIDWQTVQLVWNGLTGYPATACYRDYHHRTTHDLRPWNIGGGPYRPADAAEQAHAHARDFVARCIERLDAYAADRGRPGLLCFALDTELLGHWWYEGQQWLRAVLAEAAEQGLELTTVSRGRRPHRAGGARAARVQLGDGQGLLDVGLARRWPTWRSRARSAELRTVAAAAAGGADRRRAGARGARADGAPGQRLGVPDHRRAVGRLPGPSGWLAMQPNSTPRSYPCETPRPCSRIPPCATWPQTWTWPRWSRPEPRCAS